MELKLQRINGEEETIVRVHEMSHVESIKNLEAMAESALVSKFL